MTVEGLFASLAWSAIAGYAAWRADLRVSQWIASRETIGIAGHVSAERIAELQWPQGEPRTLPKRGDIQLPDDLDAYVNQWNDQYARDDERNAIRERFLELHTGDSEQTWQKVRTAVGIGQMP